jgi:nitrogen regulatory protein PII
MKEITAFTRIRKLDDVIRALRQTGAPDITALRDHDVGHGHEPFLFALAPSELATTPQVADIHQRWVISTVQTGSFS